MSGLAQTFLLFVVLYSVVRERNQYKTTNNFDSIIVLNKEETILGKRKQHAHKQPVCESSWLFVCVSLGLRADGARFFS